MPIPSRPTPHFLLIQTDLAFRLFKAPFNGPSAARHLPHGGQDCRMRRKHDIRRACRGVAQTPAHPEPSAPVGVQRRGQGEPLPVIPAGAFRPVAGTQPAPTLSPQRRHEGVDLVVPAGTPDLFFP